MFIEIRRIRGRTAVLRVLTVLLAAAALNGSAHVAAQGTLTLTEARAQARRTSPAVAAARAAVEAAGGLERQAGAFPNPALTYSREHTSPASQDVAALEQRLELGGQRGARITAARLRRKAAEARLELAEGELDEQVARRFADVNAARRRAEVADAAAEQFRLAAGVTDRRLAQGDVSGYEARRIRLESARYAALAAEARLRERQAVLELATLLGGPEPAAPTTSLEALSADFLTLNGDSVAALVARGAEVRAAELDAAAVEADARLARRDRVPVPSVSAGYLRQSAEGAETHGGFVAGITLPLPLWDRRGGAVAAADAAARGAAAELVAVRQRVLRATLVTLESVRRADEQVAALAASLGAEASAALRAAETAYGEGEITLVEWLDAVRAYQEAESAYAAVLAESFIQRAALERLLDVALIR